MSDETKGFWLLVPVIVVSVASGFFAGRASSPSMLVELAIKKPQVAIVCPNMQETLLSDNLAVKDGLLSYEKDGATFYVPSTCWVAVVRGEVAK